MGLFSSIGNAISSVTKPFSSFLSGSGIGDILGIGSDALGFYNDLTGNSAKVQKALMAYQAQLQNESWKYQMSNRHQLEVGDLRNAGLNPILSANSAGGIAAGIPNGALADSDSARYGARSSAALARQNAAQVASLIQTNASTQARNEAEAKAAIMNAESNRMSAVAGANRNNAEAGYAAVRSKNEALYPSNQPTPFKYINSAKGMVDSIEDFLDRRYGLPSNASPERMRRYEVHINGVGRRQ
mgnify:FL=1|jgi:hypothetical protein